MVRPIEISAALSKAQEVGRMQQNAEMRPEAAQDFQKALNAKDHLQKTQAPNPTPAMDEVVIHSDEEEKERRKIVRAIEEEDARKRREKSGNDDDDQDDEGDDSQAHIDIRI